MDNIEIVIAKLSREAGSIQPSPHPFALAARWSTGAALYLVLLVACFGIRPDLATKLVDPLYILEIGMLTVTILICSASVAAMAFPDHYQKRWVTVAPFLTLMLFGSILTLEWFTDIPPSPKPLHGIECLLCITFYSIVPAWVIFRYIRKMASTHPALIGCVALLSATGIGCLALRLSEQTDSISHLVQWHYLPMLGFSILGLWMGNKFFKGQW